MQPMCQAKLNVITGSYVTDERGDVSDVTKLTILATAVSIRTGV